MAGWLLVAVGRERDRRKQYEFHLLSRARIRGGKGTGSWSWQHLYQFLPGHERRETPAANDIKIKQCIPRGKGSPYISIIVAPYKGFICHLQHSI